MASTVINDPVSINAYRRKIIDAIEKLERNLAKTGMAVEAVSASWKDNNFMQFQQNFNADKEQIKPLCNVLRTYESDILYQLEQKLNAYISTPMHL